MRRGAAVRKANRIAALNLIAAWLSDELKVVALPSDASRLTEHVWCHGREVFVPLQFSSFIHIKTGIQKQSIQPQLPLRPSAPI
jgi:hypothetical protein